MQPISSRSGPVGADQSFVTRVCTPSASGTAVTGEGNALWPADVSTITRNVYDLDSTPATRSTPVNTTSLTPANVIFATLKTDAPWYVNGQQIDSVGYNFEDAVPGSVFSTANHRYRIVYTLTTTGGAVIIWEHLHTTESTVPN